MAVGAVTHSERWEISIGKGGVSIILPRVSCNRFVGTEDRCKQTFVEVFEATQRKADYTSSIKDTLCTRYRITYKKKVSWYYSSSSSDKDSEAFCRSWAFMAPTRSSDSPFWAASRCPGLHCQRYSRRKWNKSKSLTNEGVNRFLCPSFQLCQFFLHLTLQVPVRSLGSNIENILFSPR